jgi:uncharacterized protein (DUF1697 family)
MPRYVAFLRAINVGGRTVKMDRLQRLFEQQRFKGVETFIASGNVIFDSQSADRGALTRRIEDGLLDALGYEVATFIRTDIEVATIARHKPFRDPDIEGAAAFVVGFVADPLRSRAINALMDLTTDVDQFSVRGTEIYWLCRRRQSESTFSNAVFEKTLGLRATFRGMNTIARLALRYSPGASGRKPA